LARANHVAAKITTFRATIAGMTIGGRRVGRSVPSGMNTDDDTGGGSVSVRNFVDVKPAGGAD